MKKTRSHVLKLCLCAAALLAACPLLSACGGKEPQTVYHDDEVALEAGATYTAQLTDVPDGHSASEYTWSATGSVAVDASGLVTAKEQGIGYAYAELTADGATYMERFRFLVHAARAAFRLDSEELTLTLDALGMADGGSRGATLTLETDAAVGYGEKIDWASSDPAVVTVSPLGKGISATVAASGAGTATITASIGENETTCRVTVADAPAQADTILAFLGEKADAHFAASGSTAFIDTGNTGCTLLPAGTAGGSRYMVLVDIDDPENPGLPVPNFGAAGVPVGDIYPETLVNGAGFTSLLPKSLRASSMADVGFILRVARGESAMGPMYDNGAQGYLTTVEVRLEDAKTGEVLKILGAAQGQLDDSYYVPEGQTRVDSPLPSESAILDRLYAAIADLWLNEGEYESVAFCKGDSLYRFCGAGEIAVPETLGIEKLYCNGGEESARGIDRIAVPANAKLMDCAGWKSTRFLVAAGSPAEAYCAAHGISYDVGGGNE